jgi:hypothetical protein
MPATLRDLAKYMINVGSGLPARTNEGKKVVAETILRDLLEVTPVDTGTALVNWITQTGVPNFRVIVPYAPSPQGRMKNGRWEHTVDPSITAQANLPTALEISTKRIETAQPGEPIFISNNVEYIEELNNGSSSQAPVGFVDRAIILGSDTVKRVQVIP